MKARTSSSRTKVLLNQRRVRKGVGTGCRANCIDVHEELLSSTLKSASTSFDKVHNRFRNYRRKCDDEAQSQKNIKWLRQYNDFNEEEKSIFKSLDDGVQLMTCNDNNDGCSEAFRLFVDDISAYREDLMQRLKKLTSFVIDQRKGCNLYNLDSTQKERQKDESFRSIRMENYEEMESLKKEAESLEAQIEKSRQDITQVSLEEETIPQELVSNLESLKDFCTCLFDSDVVHNHYRKDVSCAMREIVEQWKISFGRLKDNQTKIKEGMEKDGYERERKKLLYQGLRQIHDLRKQIVDQICDDFIGLLSDAATNEQRCRLNYLRQLQEVSQSIERDEMMKQQQKECEQEQLCNERKAREGAATKHALTEYHNLKKFKAVKVLKVEEERSKIEKEERKQRVSKNAERVSFRQKKLIEKQQKRNDDLEQLRKDAADKMEKLQTLAATVPYHSAIIAKKADLTKSTAARMNDIYDYPDDSDLKDFQQGLKKFTGFTTEKVFSDPKFRLAHALHQSGKANSAYSLAVVKKLIPRQSERTTGIGGSL